MYTNGQININVAAWSTQSVAANAALLIHELGHLYDVIEGLGGSLFMADGPPTSPNAAAEAYNDALIQTNCIKH
jgi:hypothetical protein